MTSQSWGRKQISIMGYLIAASHGTHQTSLKIEKKFCKHVDPTKRYAVLKFEFPTHFLLRVKGLLDSNNLNTDVCFHLLLINGFKTRNLNFYNSVEIVFRKNYAFCFFKFSVLAGKWRLKDGTIFLNYHYYFF